MNVFKRWPPGLVLLFLLPMELSAGDIAQNFASLGHEFAEVVSPLVQKFCLDCHSTEMPEGEFDLERFNSLNEIRKSPQAWLKVSEMLDNGEMPPKDSPQLSDAQRRTLRDWIETYLNTEALSSAGDPGPILIRRLSNAEYNYTIRDLTGVDALDPTKEFPVDGAAGEGFTNVGGAQAMSPSLVQKYLDAAKEVASHAVLYPDGIGFSRFTTQRDQSDELVARIQAFYRRYTADGGGQAVNLQGIQFDTNQGGLLPLQRYIEATLQEREALRSGRKSIEDVAGERSLNRKYLGLLWKVFTEADATGENSSPLLNSLRRDWEQTPPDKSQQLTEQIELASKGLWKFNPVGHIGREGAPVVWMEPVNPIQSAMEFQLELSARGDASPGVILLAADAEDGNAHDYVVWVNPRLVLEDGLEIPLSYLPSLNDSLRQQQQQVLKQAADYLAVVDTVARSSEVSAEDLSNLVAKHGLDEDSLRLWLDFLSVGEPQPVLVKGHIQSRLANPDYPFIRGWGVDETPIVLANSSDQELRIPGISKPHSIVAHPSPTQFVSVVWQSPISGPVTVEASLSDAHPECGNGQEWFLQHQTLRHTGNLWKGDFGTGGSANLPAKTISVSKGDLVSFILGPRLGNHSCDLTHMSLTIRETAGEQRVWDLATDCSSDLQAANPHADRYGNETVWHFCQGPMDAVNRDATDTVDIPAGSLLALWRSEADAGRKKELANRVQTLVTGPAPADETSPDALLYQQLQTLVYSPQNLQRMLARAVPDERFGKHPLGFAIDGKDLFVQAPDAIDLRIPPEFAHGSTFHVTGRLDAEAGKNGTVKLQAILSSSNPEPESPEKKSESIRRIAADLPFSHPYIVNAGSEAGQKFEKTLDKFRNLFPPALCYAKIVPVDEVVTLTLYYRQDDQLKQLMLGDEETEELDRLWDELLFVSQEPIKYQVAFEQIREFATQDRPDLVKVWAPLVQGVEDRAEAFRRRLLDTEPVHVDSLVRLADRAWRRKLTETEQDSIRETYHTLRRAEIAHEEAIELTLARILTSPAFLYRLEKPGTGGRPTEVSDVELASRLSYFLWSSMPDQELNGLASAGELKDQVVPQARRMLRDPRSRRLAEQFACQWLHLRDFDQTVEKNESLYPDFTGLRGEMYRETLLFFEDLIRNDRSVLSLFDADHTFLNEALARHYGVDGVTGEDWRRVDQMKSRGRGGILGMATVLASQSGASRTSPILRGNWVYETLLGEKLPRPPAGVPIIPDEPPQGLTARQLIEQHSSVESCAKCHVKIDPYGFALEQFDTVGRLRPEPVDTKTTVADGTTIEGIRGLQDYFLTKRREDFLRQFCRKLLGYSLGREVQLSDRPLIDRMIENLSQHDYRFSTAVETIVQSDQFLRIRPAETERTQASRQ